MHLSRAAFYYWGNTFRVKPVQKLLQPQCMTIEIVGHCAEQGSGSQNVLHNLHMLHVALVKYLQLVDYSAMQNLPINIKQLSNLCTFIRIYFLFGKN